MMYRPRKTNNVRFIDYELRKGVRRQDSKLPDIEKIGLHGGLRVYENDIFKEQKKLDLTNEPFQMGRARSNSFKFGGKSVSRKQMEIYLAKDGTVRLKPLSEWVGITINEERVNSFPGNMQLVHGDKLTVRNFTFYYISPPQLPHVYTPVPKKSVLKTPGSGARSSNRVRFATTPNRVCLFDNKLPVRDIEERVKEDRRISRSLFNDFEKTGKLTPKDNVIAMKGKSKKKLTYSIVSPLTRPKNMPRPIRTQPAFDPPRNGNESPLENKGLMENEYPLLEPPKIRESSIRQSMLTSENGADEERETVVERSYSSIHSMFLHPLLNPFQHDYVKTDRKLTSNPSSKNKEEEKPFKVDLSEHPVLRIGYKRARKLSPSRRKPSPGLFPDGYVPTETRINSTRKARKISVDDVFAYDPDDYPEDSLIDSFSLSENTESFENFEPIRKKRKIGERDVNVVEDVREEDFEIDEIFDFGEERKENLVISKDTTNSVVMEKKEEDAVEDEEDEGFVSCYDFVDFENYGFHYEVSKDSEFLPVLSKNVITRKYLRSLRKV